MGQQHAVVWDRPVIQKILVRFPDGAVCCCCFLEQELNPHCSSQPSCIIGQCEATPVVVFLEQKTSSHCSSLPSCIAYLAVLAFVGEGKSWTSNEILLHVDAAIQGKIINTFTFTLTYTSAIKRTSAYSLL